MKVKKQFSIQGKEVACMAQKRESLEQLLKNNRNICSEKDARIFFSPTLHDLHNPGDLPDMEQSIQRIWKAKEQGERIVVFGDYDVDGISSSALLVKFLHEHFRCQVSWRLPHRIHDGYGLKAYFFDELASKNVTLVITVDCGTKDIEPIAHAKELGIDVIVTDHHSVPAIIPQDAIGVINPKRPESCYPFSELSGSGVAFKLLHALLLSCIEKNDPLCSTEEALEKILTQYIDIACLGTIADCMPLIGENRTITKLGLAQMRNSHSCGLRTFIANSTQDIEDNADMVGFQIGPRINASGRMDTPAIALKWLLAKDSRCDEYFMEIDTLNKKRQELTEIFTKKALETVDTTQGVLLFFDENLGAGLVGLIAGKLTEKYNRPSLVFCPATDEKNSDTYVGSCRAPEWCNILALLEKNKDFLERYGGHAQAAGLSLSSTQYSAFSQAMQHTFNESYDTKKLPNPKIRIEGPLYWEDLCLDTYTKIERFRPFGMENPKPLWLLDIATIQSVHHIGKTQEHLKIFFQEAPDIPFLFWGGVAYIEHFQIGARLQPIVEFQKNEWNNRVSLQMLIHDILEPTS